jgi:hypothetical protein
MKMNPALIAPCGMNCGICLAYLREKNRCDGCRIKPAVNFKSIDRCIIRNCIYLKETTSGFCYDCVKFPCQRLKQLDKRYRTKYGMSMINNLESIKNMGLERFTESEVERWACSNCGATICVHRENCLTCGEIRKDK